MRKLQNELTLLKGENDKIPQYKALIDDFKIKEQKLQEELNNLRINPFIQQAEERGNMFKKNQINEQRLAEIEKNLDEKEKKLQEQKIKINQLEHDNNKLRDDYNKSENQKALKKRRQ